MSYKMIWETGGVLVRFSGDLTDDDFYASNKELFSDPRFINSSYSICDFTQVEQFSITSATVMEIALKDKQHSIKNPDFKIAAVMNDEVMFGLSRVYQTITEQQAFEIKNFSNLEDARQWLEC